MVKIGHAVCSEQGTTDGAPGNQNGRELRIQNWYSRPWDTYIAPIDPAMGKKAADILRRIVECDRYGYSQRRRWSGYKAILAAGGDIEKGDMTDFDCSSLCISAYILAGAKLKATGYTRNMAAYMEKSGQFAIYRDKERTGSCAHAIAGGMFLATGHHVCMVLDDGTAPLPTSRYVRAIGSVRVRRSPVYGASICIARNEPLKLLDVDAESGWYHVHTSFGDGYITNKPKYTEVVYL